MMDRIDVYAALGVPEFWHGMGGTCVSIDCKPAARIRSNRAAIVSFLAMDTVKTFLEKSRNTDETTWIRSFRQ